MEISKCKLFHVVNYYIESHKNIPDLDGGIVQGGAAQMMSYKISMSKIYQAGPLFTDAERSWRKTLTASLEAVGHQVVWPRTLLTQEAICAAGHEAVKLIFKTCSAAIHDCDCVVALLDDSHVDTALPGK